jgi:hypothetical protein
VKFSDAEQSLAAAAAEAAGLSMGTWLATTALDAARAAAIPADAEYSVTWPDGHIRYFDSVSMFALLAEQASGVSRDVDDLEPGESITITRIRKA